MNDRPIHDGLARRTNVFLSHSSHDKTFVRRLAESLRASSVNVWYDDWEIAVGDSIVDKIFGGIDSSDVLVVVLSTASVASRWVREELNVVMRRLSERNIRLMPLVIDDCRIPTPLKHIKYADFRTDEEKGLFQLLEAISPEQSLRAELQALYNRFLTACSELRSTPLEDPQRCYELIIELETLLHSALGLRVELEFRPFAQDVRQLNLFGKIDVLLEKGIDVRSEAWNDVVRFRSSVVHGYSSDARRLLWLVEGLILDQRTAGELKASDLDRFHGKLEDLERVMRNVCL